MTLTNRARVALFFGGVSSEHEVSCVSAAAWVRALSQSPCAEKYDLITVGITKAGRWLLTPADAQRIENGAWKHDAANAPCVFSPDRADHGLLLLREERAARIRVDVAVPMLHGKNGEDGTIQGLFTLAGVPFVGAGVLGSAVCMDKAVANTLMDAAGILHCRWCSAQRAEALTAPQALCARAEQRLGGYPIFVKPANAGSSVGVSKAMNRSDLLTAMETALREDDKVVMEEFIDGQEVECAVLGDPGNPDTLFATLPGEILAGDTFYTYDDKYKNGVSKTVIPAKLEDELLRKVRDTALLAYRALCCSGLARCDFFVERGSRRVLCNEINTLPGFTAISMYPKLMEAAGIPFADLVDRLIAAALTKRRGLY